VKGKQAATSRDAARERSNLWQDGVKSSHRGDPAGHEEGNILKLLQKIFTAEASAPRPAVWKELLEARDIHPDGRNFTVHRGRRMQETSKNEEK